MIKKNLITISIITLIAIQAVPSYSGDRVVAAVGHEPITHLEVMMVRSESPDFTYSGAVDLLIERSLILQWSRKNRVSVSDEELDEIINSMIRRNNTTIEEFERAMKARGQTMDSYRKLVREYHPDKMQAKGVPEDFMKIAHEKMAEINQAYDEICKERGI